MEYGNDECVYCYLAKSLNIRTKRMHHICPECITSMVSDGITETISGVSQFTEMFGQTMFFDKDGVCHLCWNDKKMLFYSHLCPGHFDEARKQLMPGN